MEKNTGKKKPFEPIKVGFVYYAEVKTLLVTSGNYTGAGGYDDGNFGDLGGFTW